MYKYSKTCLKLPLIETKISFQDQLLLDVGQKYCKILQEEYSALLLTFIMLPFAIKTFVLSIFEGPLKTDFSVDKNLHHSRKFHTIHKIYTQYTAMGTSLLTQSCCR